MVEPVRVVTPLQVSVVWYPLQYSMLCVICPPLQADHGVTSTHIEFSAVSCGGPQHTPSSLQLVPSVQKPQLLSQASYPQVRPLHCGVGEHALQYPLLHA